MSKYLKSFSTISILTYTASLLMLTALCQNLLWQIIFTFIFAFILVCIDKASAKNSIMLSLFIGLPVLIINPLLNQAGATLIFSVTGLPAVDRIDITLEALVFACGIMLKLVNTIFVFSILNQLLHPDKLLNLISHIAGKSALITTITARMIPFLLFQLKDIADIQKTRGVNLDAVNPAQKVRAWYPFSKIILFSSLENSYGLAEAIHSKGYGTMKRTVYYNEKLRLRDYQLIIGSILLSGLVLMSLKTLKYDYFPRLDALNFSLWNSIVLAFSALMIILPVLLYKISFLIKKL